MAKRYMAIWFRYLKTDWFKKQEPQLTGKAFVLASPSNGRMLITAANDRAVNEGIFPGMLVADARAVLGNLSVLDDKPGLAARLLRKLAEWCIRYTPAVSLDLSDGLILDISGCAHLWGGEELYLKDISERLRGLGYALRTGIADTVAVAWAISRFGEHAGIIPSGAELEAIAPLAPAALRINPETSERLEKLGLRQIRDFLNMPKPTLRRRFGSEFIGRLEQICGTREEILEFVYPPEVFQERLPAPDPIVTITGIEIALQRLLEKLCGNLLRSAKGIRLALLQAYRVDGLIETVRIGTNRASSNPVHLFRLFSDKLGSIEPALGIELFVLTATKLEDNIPAQEELWQNSGGLEHRALAELLDRIGSRIGPANIQRFLPDEHHWPERSLKKAASLQETIDINWDHSKGRPLQVLQFPEPIEVTAPVPDYPPMLFRFRNKIHRIKKADGPERIEQEWWVLPGQHRDYYKVEDECGNRYWVFRLGHYQSGKNDQWFIHGFFA